MRDLVNVASSPDEGPRTRESRVPVVREEALALWTALGEVLDPELPVSLVDLGLIYDVRVDGGEVEVDLTFTATGCPCMEFIRQDLQDRLLREPGVEHVRVREVWDPPWTVARVTEAGRRALRRVGVAVG